MFTDVLQGNRSGRFSAETNAKEVLAFSHMELGNIEPARNHFQKVLEMEALEVLRSLPEMGAGDCGQRLKALCGRKLMQYSTCGMRSGRFQGRSSRRCQGSSSKRSDVSSRQNCILCNHVGKDRNLQVLRVVEREQTARGEEGIFEGISPKAVLR